MLIQVCTSLPQPVLGKMLEMRSGKYSTEAAKMMGTTPPVLSFIGMYVLWPPYIRRPTTLLANVTGMRRWHCSMNTIITRKTRASSSRKVNLATPADLSRASPWLGKPAITLVKISTDMPWPTPRWVISSASHMTTTVPAVMVMHDEQHAGHGEVGDEVDVERHRGTEQAAPTVVERVGQPGRLHDGQGDGHVAGDLGQLALAARPFVPPLLELGDDHHQQLDDDRGS